MTAALVGVLLVTFGGPTRAPAQRLAVAGTSHAGTAAKAARVPHAVLVAHHDQAPLHVDLAATPPSEASDVRLAVAVTPAETVVERMGTDLVSPTGRAPPAL